jgi:hypothetical protein
MRALYTILFFVNTLLLVGLTYLFLHKLDQRAPPVAMGLIFAGIVASIFLLVRLLRSYLRLPSDRERR